jgi:hypothetical protein
MKRLVKTQGLGKPVFQGLDRISLKAVKSTESK